MSLESVLIGSATVCAVLMVSTWILSLALHDASIVDIVWGLGFVLVVWTLHLRSPSSALTLRQDLLLVLVTLWGARLAGYLAFRNLGQGEDRRYVAMRRRWGARFPIVSLVTVFLLQGVLLWVVSLPVQLGYVIWEHAYGRTVALIGCSGVALAVFGLGFETLGDAQLARFKADPANAGAVMDRGLWSWTRHPNYFGEACFWWGIALITAETGPGAWGVLGALTITVLLLRVSGVTLLERSLSKRKPGYAEYVRRTSAFIPRPPRRG
jgi:steroid 5-alpha reductase family enzyme